MNYKKPADPTLNPDIFSLMVSFARSRSEKKLNESSSKLKIYLDEQKEKLRFPAVDDEVGEFLVLMCDLIAPKSIFEFGSGYGHSCFWYFQSSQKNKIQNIFLTERRTDLKDIFENGPWQKEEKEKILYHQGDAFEYLESLKNSFDLVLVDGEKATYKNFIEKMEHRLNPGSWVVIDNAFWKGKILDSNDQSRSSEAMKQMFNYLDETNSVWRSYFLPLSDGVLLLNRL